MRRSSSSSPTRASTKARTSTGCSARRKSRRIWMNADRHPREGGCSASLEERMDSRLRDDELGQPMMGDGCRAKLFSDQYREPLKASCAEDQEIWQIYANNFGPDGFDDSITRYTSNPANRTFVLFEGDEL